MLAHDESIPMKPLISVVVPAYNEEAVIAAFHERMNTLFDT
jgi:hypothetical protein